MCDVNTFHKNDDKELIKCYLDHKKFMLDHGIKISTIALECKIHTDIFLHTFASTIPLQINRVEDVSYGDVSDKTVNRSILPLRKKKKKHNFDNQVTILIRPPCNRNKNHINIKMFKNGSLRLTGCDNMEDFCDVVNVVIDILRAGHVQDNKTITYVRTPEAMGIYDISIRMINSNFMVDYQIDRRSLYKILNKYHGRNTSDQDIGYIEAKFEPASGHSCVNIQHYCEGRKGPSIFIFRTGSIIITGAKNFNDIVTSYKFICRVLDRYMLQIRVVPLNPILVRRAIRQFIREHGRPVIDHDITEVVMHNNF